MMITKEQCMKIILKKFPGFEPQWQEYLEFWGGETRGGLCNDMSAFSDYAIYIINENKSQQEVETIFKFIEELLHVGSEDVRDAATTCFLENLINATSAGTVAASSFVKLLGPESKAYCKAWDEFTGVKT